MNTQAENKEAEILAAQISEKAIEIFRGLDAIHINICEAQALELKLSKAFENTSSRPLVINLLLLDIENAIGEIFNNAYFGLGVDLQDSIAKRGIFLRDWPGEFRGDVEIKR